MLHLWLMRGTLWALSAFFGGFGVFILYLGLSFGSPTITIEAAILIVAAGTAILFLPH